MRGPPGARHLSSQGVSYGLEESHQQQQQQQSRMFNNAMPINQSLSIKHNDTALENSPGYMHQVQQNMTTPRVGLINNMNPSAPNSIIVGKNEVIS